MIAKLWIDRQHEKASFEKVGYSVTRGRGFSKGVPQLPGDRPFTEDVEFWLFNIQGEESLQCALVAQKLASVEVPA